MSQKHYIWKGPATGVEVWTENTKGKAELIFSGQVAPGQAIGTALPSDHSQIIGWLAFKLIEEVPDSKAKPAAAPVKSTETKEQNNG